MFTASLYQSLSLFVLAALLGDVVPLPTNTTDLASFQVTRVVDYERYIAEVAAGNFTISNATSADDEVSYHDHRQCITQY
jgi:hypothetical protein